MAVKSCRLPTLCLSPLLIKNMSWFKNVEIAGTLLGKGSFIWMQGCRRSRAIAMKATRMPNPYCAN
jgi:hypothetical protein